MKRLVHWTALLAATVSLVAIAPTADARAAAARPRALPSHQLGAAAQDWIGATDAATAAFSTATGGTFLRPDREPATTVPAPDGCTPSAAGGGLIAYRCGPWVDENFGLVQHLAVTDTAGRERARVDERIEYHNGAYPVVPDAVGAQWIHSAQYDSHAYRDLYVNWHTGEVRQTNVEDGSVADLDAPGLRATLCRPLKPFVDHDPDRIYAARPYTLPSWERGGWVLRQTAYAPVAFRLQRCGAKSPVKLPVGFAGRPVLGDGWLAAAGADGIHLLRLADRRPFSVAMPDNTYTVLHLTRDRLYFGSYLGFGAPWRTVQLPKR